MRKNLIGIAAVATLVSAVALTVGVAWGAGLVPGESPVIAQVGGVLPPTIISFTSDLPSIAAEAAEAGETTALLSWQTVGVTASDRIELYAYRLNAWEALIPSDSPPLQADGSYVLTVKHPLNFGPPTYNLMIVDAAGAVLDQRVLMIPYDLPENPPDVEIAQFATDVQALDTLSVLTGTARVAVTWNVLHRPPSANLVFEQVLEGGRAESVELPRPNLWIPSSGQGVVAPVPPSTGEPVRLRLRVVDMTDGSTLAEQLLDPLPLVSVGPTPVPTLTPVPPPPVVPTVAVPPAQILSFTAAPETVPRGGSITVGWQVINAVDIGVWLIEPGGRLSQAAPNPQPSGAWTVTLPDYYTTTVTFMLFATDAAGNQVQQGLTRDIICPYTYFFGGPYEGETCPKEPARTVQAAFEAFENGVMLWRGDTGEIIVLYNDTHLVEHYRDTWQGEEVRVPETPPDGLYQPVRGFGRLWVDNPQVRARIGWATTLEQGYTMTYQASGDFKYTRSYMDWPDGTVIYLVENTWAIK